MIDSDRDRMKGNQLLGGVIDNVSFSEEKMYARARPVQLNDNSLVFQQDDLADKPGSNNFHLIDELAGSSANKKLFTIDEIAQPLQSSAKKNFLKENASNNPRQTRSAAKRGDASNDEKRPLAQEEHYYRNLFQAKIETLQKENELLRGELNGKIAHIARLEASSTPAPAQAIASEPVPSRKPGQQGPHSHNSAGAAQAKEAHQRQLALTSRIRELENRLRGETEALHKTREVNQILTKALEIKNSVMIEGDKKLDAGKIAAAFVELGGLKDINAKVMAKCEELSTKLQIMNEEHDELLRVIEELKLIRESNTAELTKQEIMIQGLKRDAANSVKTIETSTREVALLHEHIDGLNKRIHDMSEQIMLLKKVNQEGSESELQLSIKRLRLELEKQMVENGMLTKELEEFRRKYAETEEKVRYMTEALRDNQNEMDEMKRIQQNKARGNWDNDGEIDVKGVRNPEQRHLMMENRQLKEALKESLERSNALNMKDAENQRTITLLEAQLEQSLQSRKKMEDNLITQVTGIQRKYEQVAQEFEAIQHANAILDDENQALKHVVREGQKKEIRAKIDSKPKRG